MPSFWSHFTNKRRPSYHLVPSDMKANEVIDLKVALDSDRDSRSQADYVRPFKRRRSFFRRPSVLTIFNLALFATSLGLFLAGQPFKHGFDSWAKRWIPHKSLQIPLVDKQINGTLFPGPDPQLGRLPPGTSTDNLWADWEIQRRFALSRSDILSMGKDPSKSVKIPDSDFGLGNETYLGSLDIYHVLHCFNEIRKEAFKDYFFDGSTGQYHLEHFSSPESHMPERVHGELFWVHLLHCTDTVLQNLMCSADLSMYSYVWMETQEHPMPDFNINKKCTDFDALQAWRDENEVDLEGTSSMTRPTEGGYYEQKVADGYWELFGEGGSNFHVVP